MEIILALALNMLFRSPNVQERNLSSRAKDSNICKVLGRIIYVTHREVNYTSFLQLFENEGIPEPRDKQKKV